MSNSKYGVTVVGNVPYLEDAARTAVGITSAPVTYIPRAFSSDDLAEDAIRDELEGWLDDIAAAGDTHMRIAVGAYYVPAYGNERIVHVFAMAGRNSRTYTWSRSAGSAPVPQDDEVRTIHSPDDWYPSAGLSFTRVAQATTVIQQAITKWRVWCTFLANERPGVFVRMMTLADHGLASLRRTHDVTFVGVDAVGALIAGAMAARGGCAATASFAEAERYTAKARPNIVLVAGESATPLVAAPGVTHVVVLGNKAPTCITPADARVRITCLG